MSRRYGSRFVLPPGSEATVPPEARGLARDEVRMAVVTQDGPTTTRRASCRCGWSPATCSS